MNKRKRTEHELKPIGTAAIPWIKPGYSLRSDDAANVVLGPESEEVCQINPPATLIWSLCDGSHTVGAISELLTKQYPDAASEIREDIDKTLAAADEVLKEI